MVLAKRRQCPAAEKIDGLEFTRHTLITERRCFKLHNLVWYDIMIFGKRMHATESIEITVLYYCRCCKIKKNFDGNSFQFLCYSRNRLIFFIVFVYTQKALTFYQRDNPLTRVARHQPLHVRSAET